MPLDTTAPLIKLPVPIQATSQRRHIKPADLEQGPRFGNALSDIFIKECYPIKAVVDLVGVILDSKSCGYPRKDERDFSYTLAKNEDFYHEPTLTSVPNPLRRVERVLDYSPAIKQLLSSNLIHNALFDLLGEKQILFKDKVNYKPPSSTGFRPHIDGHFFWRKTGGDYRRGWLDYADSFINLVLPIDPCLTSNGCLYLANLTQTQDIFGLDWLSITNQLDSLGPYLRSIELNQLSFFPLELNSGDIALFDWRLPHYSLKNRSTQYRRIFYATFHGHQFGDNRDAYYIDKRSSENTIEQKALYTEALDG